MNEIWKDIPWYEGLYQVSSCWVIKSYPKMWSWWHLWKTMKLSTNWNWYAHLYLTKNKNRKLFSVHRIVAMTFLENVENKKEVNHIDGNRINNKLENLEWCTHWENERHKYKLWYTWSKPWLWKKSWEHKRSASVAQYTIMWDFVRKWECITDIYRELWYSRGNISTVCKWKRKIANGFIWKYI